MSKFRKLAFSIVALAGIKTGAAEVNAGVLAVPSDAFSCVGRLLRLDISKTDLATSFVKHPYVNTAMNSNQVCLTIQERLNQEAGASLQLTYHLDEYRSEEYEINPHNFRGTGKRIYYDMDVVQDAYQTLRVEVLDFTLSHTDFHSEKLGAKTHVYYDPPK